MIVHREKLLKEILEKKRRVKEVADILDVKRETVSRWFSKYRFEGLDGICPKKPGPKRGSSSVNRTSAELEKLVCEYAQKNNYKGPRAIADLLEEQRGVK